VAAVIHVGTTHGDEDSSPTDIGSTEATALHSNSSFPKMHFG
jgi:hypothetical protein